MRLGVPGLRGPRALDELARLLVSTGELTAADLRPPAGPGNAGLTAAEPARSAACPPSAGPLPCLRVPRERVLVTGSAGHLGEALVRILRAPGATSWGWTCSPRRSPPCRIGHRPRLRPRAGRRRPCSTPPRCTSPTSGRTRGRSSWTRTSRGRWRCSRRPSPPGWRLRLHQHHQRLRPGAHPAAGRAGGVDHRGVAPVPRTSTG